MSKQIRPDDMEGMTHRIKTACGWLYITVNFDRKGKPFEVFVRLGKSGCCNSVFLNAVGRLISINLRDGGDIDEIIMQLIGMECDKIMLGEGEKKINSCPDAIAKGIKAILEERNKEMNNGK